MDPGFNMRRVLRSDVSTQLCVASCCAESMVGGVVILVSVTTPCAPADCVVAMHGVQATVGTTWGDKRTCGNLSLSSAHLIGYI